MARKQECLYCLENGEEHKYSSRDCRSYPKQVAWNKRMKRLLAADGVIQIPEAPDYSLKALEAWTVAQSVTPSGEGDNKSIKPNTWWRETHALLQKEPKSWKGFSFMPKGEVI